MPTNDSITKINMAIDSMAQTVVAKTDPAAVIIKDTIIQQAATPIAAPTVNITSQAIDLNISPLVIIIFVGLGVGLYFLMAFLRSYILPVIVQRYQKLNIELFWFRFSTVIWFAFGLLGLYVFLKGSVIITSITIVTIGAIFYNFIFDFMLGIYFQFENHIKRKAQFRLNDVQGEIKSFHTRHIKIQDKQGEEVYLPYRNLLNAPIRIIKQVDSFTEKSFLVLLDGDPAQNAQMLQRYMIMCPWIHDSGLYTIQYISDRQYRINVRVKETFTANKIESFIQSKVR